MKRFAIAVLGPVALSLVIAVLSGCQDPPQRTVCAASHNDVSVGIMYYSTDGKDNMTPVYGPVVSTVCDLYIKQRCTAWSQDGKTCKRYE
jgi:hypothetical protein